MNGNYGSQEQRRQSGLKSGGSWNLVKNVDFSRHISKNFDFFSQFYPKNGFSKQKLVIYSYFLANYSNSIQKSPLSNILSGTW